MTEDEIIKAIQVIEDTNALWDWLEMFDSHQCEASYEKLIASTVEYTYQPRSLDDILGIIGAN